MSYGNGTVTTFDGATGFLQALLDFCAGDGYTQNIGTGTGSAQAFSGTISNTPPAKGNIRLEFIKNGTLYKVYDDGTNWDQHEYVTSSSINYSTGAYSATIDADSGESIDITYCVGQNSGEEGRDWLVLLNQTTRTPAGAEEFPGGDPIEVVLKNSGVSYQESIYIGLRETKLVSAGFYAINFNIFYDFDEDDTDWNYNKNSTGRTSYDSTYKNYSQHPKIALDNASMALWVMSSKNRIMGVVRPTSGVYESFYIGAGLRFSSPSSYASPLCAIGSSYANGLFSDTSSIHKFIVSPSTGATYSWWAVNVAGDYKFNDDLRSIPLADISDVGTMAKTTDSKILRYPAYVYDTDNNHLLMELEGVFVCPCTGIQSEDTITDGADNFLIVQDIFRTTDKSFMCLEQA